MRIVDRSLKLKHTVRDYDATCDLAATLRGSDRCVVSVGGSVWVMGVPSAGANRNKSRSIHYVKGPSLTNILIDNRFMTAVPLIEAHDAIMTEIGFRDDPVQKEVLDQVSKEFHALVDERNKIVHGLWMIGWARSDDPDFSKISGHIGRPSKREGMSFQELPTSAEEIVQLVERARKLGDLLMHIHAFLTPQSTKEGRKKLEDVLIKVGGVWTSERVKRAGPP